MLGRTNSMTGPYGAGDPSSDLSVAVTHPAGAICTISNGEKTLRSVDEVGQCIFFLPESGEWVVNFTDDQDSRNQVVDISGDNTTADVELDYSVTRQYLTDTLVHYESDIDTVIGENAFSYRNSLETVKTSATKVEARAFQYCEYLTTIEFTNSEPVDLKQNLFTSDGRLRAIILRSSTLSILNANTFSNTSMLVRMMGVYVPASLLSAYKAATNWSVYADNIYPIESYPIAEYGTITDSWETIFANEVNGTYSTKYSVGDTKQFVFNEQTPMLAEIVAIDTDNLADNSGKAKITWITLPVVESRRMNSTNTTNGGWVDSELRTYLRSTGLSKMPVIIQNNIKEVTKTYYDYETTSTLSISDTLWVPSFYEITGNNTLAENSGVSYTAIFGSDSYNTYSKTRVKRFITSYSQGAYRLRSAYSATSFWAVGASGNVTYGSDANSTSGVVFGFCT